MTFPIILGIAILTALIFWFIGYYYLLKHLTDVEDAWELIHRQFERRKIMVKELEGVMEPYASITYETKEKLEEKTNVMTSPFEPRNERMEANDELALVLRDILESAEDQPQITALESYQEIKKDLEDSAKRISFARKVYNRSVTKYNRIIQVYPTKFVSSLHNFKKRESIDTLIT
ncbi:LemA protein [Salsuginibacillus halophilus]|uniref:LemA protein n=1 Tax=Salsuginibacillus halophilus TaxID=517424 RepID=A0A2P8HG41_9BACI|nr:LemA family protein [Salsuginibacillus halophilus]PSL45187.1 LemA protein [Salsuginibacillus halophilus]